MRNALRLLVSALGSFLVAFLLTTNSGCPSHAPAQPAPVDAGPADCSNPFTCYCHTSRDCTPGRNPNDQGCGGWLCTPAHQCITVCCQTPDCSAGEVCFDGFCHPPGCGDSTECRSNQCCLGGTCGACPTLPQGATCAVEPAQALLHANATKLFSVIAKDASGQVIPLVGDAAWALDSAVGGVTPDPAHSSIATVSGAVTAGAGQLTAQLGSVICTPASLTNFAAPITGQFRVVVASQADQSLLSDATVVVNDETQTSATGGAYVFSHVTTPATVSAYRGGSAYVTMLGVTTNDVIVFLKPMLAPASLTGTVTPASFDGLSDVKGTVHLMLAGTAIQGSLFDFDPSLLLGAPVKTHIDLGGTTQTDVDLPRGVAIGFGAQMFKGDYTVAAAPGTRAVWAFGGNVVLSDVLGVVSSATSGGMTDVGSVLSALIPVVGKLQSGVTVDKAFVSGTPGALTLKLDTLLRLQTVIATPTLPGVNAVLSIGGARSLSQGFVPLGLTAGVDEHTGPSTTDMTPDGIIDPAGMNGTPGELPLRLAPLHGGLEGSPFEIVTLALNTSALFGGRAPLTLSARVLLPGSILFKNNGTAANTFQVGAFLPIPDAALDSAARTLTVSPVTGADLYRADFAAGWQVYFPPSMNAAALTTPPSGFDDRLASTATLRAVSLKLKAGMDYQSAVQFDGDNVDDLSAATDAFAVRTITR
jgi:hypothetical protein